MIVEIFVVLGVVVVATRPPIGPIVLLPKTAFEADVPPVTTRLVRFESVNALVVPLVLFVVGAVNRASEV